MGRTFVTRAPNESMCQGREWHSAVPKQPGDQRRITSDKRDGAFTVRL